MTLCVLHRRIFKLEIAIKFHLTCFSNNWIQVHPAYYISHGFTLYSLGLLLLLFLNNSVLVFWRQYSLYMLDLPLDEWWMQFRYYDLTYFVQENSLLHRVIRCSISRWSAWIQNMWDLCWSMVITYTQCDIDFSFVNETSKS